MLAATLSLQARADTLPGLTVEAQRQHEQLKHDVNAFVATAIVQSRFGETLERWTHEPVCPLVSGLKKDQGEFILARLSQIVRNAGAPLGPENCKPNFFIIVSSAIDPWLKKIAGSNGARAFNYETGPQLRKFLETPRPIRVWRNAGLTSIDGSAMMSSLTDMSDPHAAKFGPLTNSQPSQYGSRLHMSAVTRDILSVIVIVDAGKVLDLNFGQLTDYIAMVGLADVDLDKDLGNAPTILSVFRTSKQTRPQEMSDWDKALLHALYSTSHKDKMQLSEMQTAALNEIVADQSGN